MRALSLVGIGVVLTVAVGGCSLVYRDGRYGGNKPWDGGFDAGPVVDAPPPADAGRDTGPPVDAGRDGGMLDAGAPDSAQPDSGAVDAAVEDAP